MTPAARPPAPSRPPAAALVVPSSTLPAVAGRALAARVLAVTLPAVDARALAARALAVTLPAVDARAFVAALLLLLAVAACAPVHTGRAVTSRAASAPALLVVAAGDVQLGPRAAADPLAAVAPLLAGDLRFANLESPLTDRAPERGLDADGRPDGTPVHLAAPAARAAWLAGRLDVVSLANNHALDQGAAGRADTARALAAARVAVADETRDAELRVRGREVAIVARAYPPTADLAAVAGELADAVARARRRGAAVLVSLHFGHTGSLLPTDGQRALAARAVEAGASAVLGHGPHSPQGVERRGRAVIAYSLGNLAFDCRCTGERDAYLLAFSIDAAGAARDVRLVPIEAGIAGAPASPARDPGLSELLATLSEDLGSDVTTDDAGVVHLR